MRLQVGRHVAALGLPAVLILAGCSIGDIRRTPPERAVPSADAAVPPRVAAVEERPMRVPVPAGYSAPFIQFDNANHGYAHFYGCDAEATGDPAGCPPLLFASFDGGETWQQRDHPAPEVTEHSMLVGYANLVLTAGTDWYRSADGASTFTRATSPDGSTPPEFAVVDGRYQVCCGSGGVGRVVEVTEQGMTPLAEQPPIPAVQTVGYLGDKLTVAGLHEGRLHVAFGAEGVSVRIAPDDGSVMGSDSAWHWQSGSISIAEPERIRRLVVRVAPSGERWLIGERVPGEPPVLWRVNGVRLELVTIDELPADVVSVLPIDDGRLLVTTRAGAGMVVDGRYVPVGWPVGGAHLTRLWDGTLQASRPDGTVLLSPAQQTGLGWVQVSWDPS
jgi:hypothetical protein